jgi:hypothetical protein
MIGKPYFSERCSKLLRLFEAFVGSIDGNVSLHGIALFVACVCFREEESFMRAFLNGDCKMLEVREMTTRVSVDILYECKGLSIPLDYVQTLLRS